ncbi:MAG: long-chain fatty acid--CoA ligase [Gammaproteobacteria bacterium]|nr:long-chain fatty acid--CoA ligase [Gammaproteobacteria bacterium]
MNHSSIQGKNKNFNEVEPITPGTAKTLSGLFIKRCNATPNKTAYHFYDNNTLKWKSLTWSESYNEVIKWRLLFQKLGLKAEDNIAIMMRNCPNWIFSEQAALSLGMIVVPLYPNDRPENIAYILKDANVKALITENSKQVESLSSINQQLNQLTALITVEEIASVSLNNQLHTTLKNLILYSFNNIPSDSVIVDTQYEDMSSSKQLATIVYTSGTTGKPKGVMLTHQNILFDTWASISAVPCQSEDKFLSFLPLSHMFERTAGYYIPMMSGAEVAYARSIDALPIDLQTIKPTVLVTVPRIFERVHQKITHKVMNSSLFAKKLFNLTIRIGWKRFLYQQHKHIWFPGLLLWPLLNNIIAKKVMAKLGGHLRLAISGGAPLSNEIAQFFIGLGLTITQGYGMTEAGPVISTNKLEDNDPFSVGQILPGIKTRFEKNGELLIKAKSVMKGYWNNESATKKVITSDGWLHTGDKAEIKNNHLYITGRVKEILVLSNGEKVPPADLEMAICSDPTFEQAIVIGEAKPYLSAIIVINEEYWNDVAEEAHVNSIEKNALQNKKVCHIVTKKIATLLNSFPGYEQIRRVKLILSPWTINNGMLTPTMKLKRNKIIANYKDDINKLYAGHI